MKRGGKMLVCVVGGLAVCTAASGVTTESASNPYQSIVDRNVFSLKPPPPPPDPADANKPTVLKITLTGITTIFGDKRVLMKTAAPPGKAGEAPKTEQSYILSQGQREGDIEVMEIDEKAGSVKVNNAGTIQTLTFEKDGAKLPATPAPAAVPGAAGQVIPGLPVNRGQAPGAVGNTPGFQLPNRIPRLQGAQAAGAAGAQGGFGAAPMAGTPGFLPGNSITPVAQNQNTAGAASTAPGQTQTITGVPQYSLEEQAILIEANRQAGGPGAALLPPTPLTPKQENPALTPTQPQTPTINLPIPGRPY